MTDLPRFADTIVIGGGTAGAAVAGRLAENSERSILLLEAGPDYGALSKGKWPPELLDACALPPTHDWGYVSSARNGVPQHPLERARVIGGCSSHNGCAAIWGHRADYDAWAQPGWSTDDLLPLFHEANERLRVRVIPSDELTPWFRACLDAARSAGIPLTQNLNDLDEAVAMGPSPVNIERGTRWNTSFAYLDPVRSRPNLTIVGNALVNCLRVAGERVTAVEVFTPEGPRVIEGERFVLCAGAYASPGILLRSGIGDEQDLRALGIAPALNLRGVGRNLHDHPTLYLKYSGTPHLIIEMQAFVARGGTIYTEQSIAKLRSAHCSSAFDLHLFPIGGPFPGAGTREPEWQFILPIANMTPCSRGTVTLTSRDPYTAPQIDVGYLTDADDADLRVLKSGIEIARDFARQSPLAELIGEELPPTASGSDAEMIRRSCLHYYHPVGTCKMGPASDPEAVVDSRGRVYGTRNLYVADASVLPTIPRANTNVPVLVVAERIAQWLCASA